MIVNPCSDGRTKADAVVEVVVRLDDLRDALAGHECIDHLEDRLERGIRTVGLDHGDVVVEFEERVAVHVPHVVGDLDRLSGSRCLRRARPAAPRRAH